MSDRITPLRWSEIRDVLPHEAHDFTPWLADNLELLGEAIGLEELEIVETEAPVEDFRLDILARGTDASGDEIEVVIENQYGKSDHDHLGKLVTYAAKVDPEAERVLAVWLVERPAAAHTAAVEFLNRTSVGRVGWFLVRPRFAPAPDGYYVHFDAEVEPNEFLRARGATGASASSGQKAVFMNAVADAATPELRNAGYRHVWCHPDGRVIRVYLPNSHPASQWLEIRVLSAKQRVRLNIFAGNRDVSPDANVAILEGVRQRHGRTIARRLDGWPEIDWNAGKEGERSAYARVTFDGEGYVDGDANSVAERFVEFATAVLDCIADDGDEEFPPPDEASGEVARADAETIMAIAQHVEPGEWVSYGDLSRVAIGTSSAAMAVGNIAANNPDFPNPHRLLTRKGQIPDSWQSSEGGPEVCRARLEAEGVKFGRDGGADPNDRLDVEILSKRFEAASGA